MHHDTINPWIILPFVFLLGAIALMPLVAHEWWESHYPKIVLILSLITLVYYLGFLHEFRRPLEVAHEYVSFICLIGSLFVISGGIHIRVKGEAKPWVNTLFLAIGGMLANILGTTGASMLLIRPFLRANKYRLTTYHVVFFIFIVSNVGGSLTPIGDPPLYLGYLQGIPFFWTIHTLFFTWLMGMGWLLFIFYLIDRQNFLRAPPEIRERETAHETWAFDGLHNLIWLGSVLIALWIPRLFFVREAIMILAVLFSQLLTPRPTYEANNFSWAPIREIAILFAGIFMTMIPTLDWLRIHAKELGIISVSDFYWGCGLLSSVLDNAPTYLTFLNTALGLFTDQTISDGIPHLIANYSNHLAAISISAVFFGACTYIGNGPNFMVKSIAEHSGAKMPSFFGYIFKFTLPILFPMFFGVWWLFFR